MYAKQQLKVHHGDAGTDGGLKTTNQQPARYSTAARACPYDNSCMESFFATLKKECIYRRRYVTMEEVKKDILSYVELFYNGKRMHLVWGYLSPVAYRRKNQGGEAA